MIDVILLAIIQALTEFIPVSSSGHLIAAQEIFGLESSLALDVALHFGTLLALVAYFASRLRDIALHLQSNTHLLISLALTSIPAAVIGFTFDDVFAEDARNLGVVIVMLAVVGVIMLYSESLFTQNKRIKAIEQISYRNALLIGLGQAIALIPGTSRSGITMLAGKYTGLSNKLAAEYAFLAGIPVIAGAALKVFIDPETNQVLSDNLIQVLVGIIVAFAVGLVALRFLIQYVADNGLRVFGWYRLGLAAILLIIWLNQ